MEFKTMGFEEVDGMTLEEIDGAIETLEVQRMRVESGEPAVGVVNTHKPKPVFKGIWIPKEIWEDKSLNCTDRCLLAEIYSLDNGQGCFASNKHLAEFIGIGAGAINNILRGMRERGLLVNLELRKNDWERKIKRRMRVVHEGYHFYRVTSKVAYKPSHSVKRIQAQKTNTQTHVSPNTQIHVSHGLSHT